MSGYDALDELYERLRGTEDARRAGGITSETIRAARGGVVDGCGRGCHVVDKNAADGDSEPLAGIPRDTRERIEADAWEAARLDMSRTWEERRDAIVALLDRQAALTEREACAYCDYKDANRRQAHKIHEVCKCLEDSYEREKKLQAKLDELNDKLTTALNNQKTLEDRLWEYDQTHMLLPVDADGVPIKMGDNVVIPQCYEGIVVSIEVGDMETLIGVDGHDGYLRYGNSDIRHVEPRTVEDVLRDLVDGIGSVDFDALTAIDGAAAEIRELMEVDR